MDKHELFEAWAPQGSVWSAWAKPVLFAHWPRPVPTPEPRLSPDLNWLPSGTERTALVVDLPGVDAVSLGVALVERNYRPVPIFNGCPMPLDEKLPTDRSAAVIDVDSTLAALAQFGPQLRQRVLPAEACPAFLVDAQRQQPLQPIRPGQYDNRSLLFATDFPSAKFLASQRIERVLVVVQGSRRVERDLGYVLRTWQHAGMGLSIKHGIEPGPIQPLTIGGWWLFFNAWNHFSSALRLSRNSRGGYGGFVPMPSSG